MARKLAADGPDDDLFHESTMTFGEHLDELRRALVRSSIALAIAMLLAFPFADDLVLFVEQPLTRALGRLEHARAAATMSQHPEQHWRLADALMMQEGNLIPRRVLIDRTTLLGVDAASGVNASDSTASARRTELPWESGPFPQAQELTRTWVATAHATPADPRKILFERLSPEAQSALKTLNANTAWKDADTQQVRAILTDLLNDRTLVKNEEFKVLAKKLPSSLAAYLAQFDTHSSMSADASSVQDANALLLHAAFPDWIPLPTPKWAEITIWERSNARLQSLNAPEPFMIWMKALVVLGLVIASPFIFYFIWQFVASGLYRHERQLVHFLLPASLILFFAGASLAFFFVFDPVLDFLFSFNLKMNIEMQPRVSDWMSFVLLLPLGFGVSFQLPLVMLALERMGIVDVATFTSKWRMAIMIIFVLSSVLTPADPLSMLFMAIPLTFLYFGGIWFCHISKRSASPLGVGRDP